MGEVKKSKGMSCLWIAAIPVLILIVVFVVVVAEPPDPPMPIPTPTAEVVIGQEGQEGQGEL